MTMKFKAFDLQTLQECLTYACDAFDWLVEDNNLPSVSNQLTPLLIGGISRRVTSLLCNVNGLHNRCAAINKLPPEILALVFGMLLDSFPRVGEPSKSITMRRLNLDHVCHYWRQTAISTARLWTLIRIPEHVSSKPHSDLYLSRSLHRAGILPITIHLDSLSSRADCSLFSNILPNFPCLQDLRITRAREDQMKPLESSAAQLTTLMIQSRIVPYMKHDRYALFNSWQTPQLQTVVMKECNAWRTLSCRNLRNLIIGDLTFGLADIKALLDVLSLNVSLEDFILQRISLEVAELGGIQAWGRLRRRINMPNLSRVIIGSNYLLFTELMSTALALDAGRGCAVCYMPHQDSRLDYSSFQSHPLCSLFAPCRKLCLAEDGTIGIDGKSAFFNARYSSATDCLCILQSSVQASQVEELWFLTDDEDFMPVLQRMSHVTKVSILETFGGNVLSWLPRLADPNLFPELKELWVDADIDDGFVEETTNEEILQGILQLVRFRQAVGRQICTLRFTHKISPKYSDIVFQELRRNSAILAQLVDHVYFDLTEDWPSVGMPPVCTTPSSIHTEWEPWPWPSIFGY